MRQRIKAVIDAKPELTVRSVSLAAGLSDSMLHKFLRGGTDSMTIKSAEKLAHALGVDPIWLIFGEGDPDQATDLGKVFERIPQAQREQALRVLETFARTGTDG
jgi:transcriptional regulator with XRE-family HTH domain